MLTNEKNSKLQNLTEIKHNSEISLYKLTNKNSIEVNITNYGATIFSLLVPSKNGKIDVDKMEIIAFDMVNNTYRVLGENVGKAFKDGFDL